MLAARWLVRWVRRTVRRVGRAGLFAPVDPGVAGVAAPVVIPDPVPVAGAGAAAGGAAVARGAPLLVSGVWDGMAPGDAVAGPPAVCA